MKDVQIDTDVLINLLHSEDADCIKNAVGLLAQSGDDRAIDPLIALLQKTPHAGIRNAAALALRDFEDERAKEPLLRLVTDPKTQGHRGTLIYALEVFDCRDALDILVDTVIEETFEASLQAFTIIKEMSGPVESNMVAAGVVKVERALTYAVNDRKELLEDLLELLQS